MKRILACKEKTRNIPIPPIPLYTLAHQEESLYTDKNPYNRAFGNGYTEMKMSIRQNMERIEILSFQNTWANSRSEMPSSNCNLSEKNIHPAPQVLLEFACWMLGKSSKHILPNGGETWWWIAW